MANTIFQDLINEGVVLVYLDDILIHNPDWQQHTLVLGEVLRRIQKYNLQLQWKKCQWGVASLKFLGFIISATGISMDPAKIKAITDYPTPANVKTLQSFLGPVIFSLQFIPQVATVTQPLRILQKKGTQFTCSTACIKGFNEVKKLIIDEATLAFPNFSCTLRVQTNASNVGIGAVLLQQDHRDECRPISYINQALTNAEQNYSTTKKEFLAEVVPVDDSPRIRDA